MARGGSSPLRRMTKAPLRRGFSVQGASSLSRSPSSRSNAAATSGGATRGEDVVADPNWRGSKGSIYAYKTKAGTRYRFVVATHGASRRAGTASSVAPRRARSASGSWDAFTRRGPSLTRVARGLLAALPKGAKAHLEQRLLAGLPPSRRAAHLAPRLESTPADAVIDDRDQRVQRTPGTRRSRRGARRAP